jgi:hypothetical protein
LFLFLLIKRIASKEQRTKNKEQSRILGNKIDWRIASKEQRTKNKEQSRILGNKID